MSETLAERLDAVERALTDGEADLDDVRDRAALSAELDRFDDRLDEIEARLEELDAALEAVRGYAGNVRAVNRDVERRASAALAKAEALETALEAPDDAGTTVPTALSSTADSDGTDASPRDETERSDGAESWHSLDAGGDRESSRNAGDDQRETGRRAPTVPTESSSEPAGGRARSGGPDGEEGDTEQFIERVRDAL
jgi:hypothetical protein